MSNASVERNIAPEILHEAAREAGYSLEQRDGRYILKGAGRVGSEVYQRKVEEVMANVSDALADKGVWNSPQAHETLETLSHSFRGFDPDSPDNGNYGSESHETKWGFPSLVAGLFGAAAITGVAYGLAKEFAPHLPDLGHLSFTMGASGESARSYQSGDIHDYPDMVSNLEKFKTDSQAAIADASLDQTDVQNLHSDISDVNAGMQIVFSPINNSDFNQTAKQIRGDMEKLQTPNEGDPIPLVIDPEKNAAFQSGSITSGMGSPSLGVCNFSISPLICFAV